ncbi:LysM repeat protein [Caldicellulosiruptor bescii]|uniref:Peptidoglycan-binding LysM n=2 Tax=Caldicellulosiruptor bescii TaxID=31899 RepID=B9MPC5_CALBD|nr:LysM peptidoglycan-binding domain-containing protein [Caldicellulosiruptor bescii]ACM59686.1 Peptidoglycan-binding LysM [Caldicellulosiruptor bescii DSM 6725]PBC89711.1 LysM repeat protein [Caldicellulosiruptor bescii]PBC90034.1 LysM repeat protein [Caldicellulosiruptor bescii]PBD04535.1 LysM repeat protein [Caldicellulosiruptor bescii]PBD05831.1 LysM repeat protein [Caldicellulosiruptor bescii]
MKSLLRFWVFVVTIIILSLFIVSPSFASDIKKEEALFFDSNGNPSYITIINKSSVAYLSPYELSKVLGGNFAFDPKDYNFLQSKLIVDQNELIFKLDSNVVTFNGKNFYMDGPIQIIQNRICVPYSTFKTYLNLFEYRHYTSGKRMIFKPNGNYIVYSVQSGDSLWILSQTFGTSIETIKNLNSLTSDTLYVGQKLIVKKVSINPVQITGIIKWWTYVKAFPSSSAQNLFYLTQGQIVNIIGKQSEFYKISSAKGTGFVSIWAVDIKQDISDVSKPSSYFYSYIPVDTSGDYVSYTYYKVQSGDTIWSIAVKFGIPDYELMSANNLNENSYIYAGQTLKVPVHTVAVHLNEYGVEMLDWFSQGNYVFPIGSVGKFIDIQTGKYFFAKRTMGASHADVETLSFKDTQIMKEIFGGSFTWERRPFILEINGRRIAVSVSGMPHAGVDGVPYNQNVANRSGGYGYGPNLDTIVNGMDGHFDVYTFNGLRHKDNQIDPQHQLTVSIAAGLR